MKTENSNKKKYEKGQGIFDKQGKISSIDDVIVDITERKQAKETLQAIADYTYDWESWFAPDGRLMWLNPAVEKLTGYSTEECRKMSCYPLPIVHEDDRAEFGKRLGKAVAEQSSINDFTFRVSSKNGSVRWMAISWQPIYNEQGEHIGLRTSVRDISERKKVEDTLRDSEEHQRALSAASFEAIFISDKGICLSQNLTAQKMFGYTLEEAVGRPGTDWIVPEERDKVINHIMSGDEFPYETIALRKNGTTFAAEIQGRMFNYKGGLCRVTALRDITERKRAEKELRHLHNYLSNIINSMPSVLVGVDSDGKVTLWNAEAQRATGNLAKDAVGRRLELAFPQLADEIAQVREAMQTGKVKIDSKRVRRENDETFYEDVTVYPLIANGVEGAVIRIDDVTEKIRLEEMMVQSEKMLSVGGLAAGMAHEINNPLAGMMQTANNMSNRLTNINLPANLRAAKAAGVSVEAIRAFMESRGILRMLTTIDESGQRVADIVENMLSFSRKSDSTFSTHDIASLLDITLQLASTDYDLKKQYDFKSIEIVKEYEDNLPVVPCEGAKIQQVLLNILRNGAEAMQKETKKEYREGWKGKKPCFILRLAHEQAANYVCIEIADNGPGMDKSARKRVFEPFFTTKSVGNGTGLGLSVSYFIITENHGGEMSVESTPDEGTKFIIRLPLKKKDGS